MDLKNVVDFSKAVSKLAVEKARVLGVSKDILQMVEKAATYHALGKVVKGDSDDFPTYNEISWAIICGDDSFEESVANTIYWTEARYYNSDKAYWDNQKDILSNLTKEQMDIIKLLALELNYEIRNLKGREDRKVPSLYLKENSTLSSMENSEIMVIRACVISAIRTLEKETSETIEAITSGKSIAKNMIESSDKKSLNKSLVLPRGYDAKRFNLQKNILKDIYKNKTTIVKAPSGFGKTLMGCLYAGESNKRIFWVCPRNVIAETVFENIKKELKSFDLNLSIELFLTGERKDTWVLGNQKTLSDEVFTADIVVTNIDSILKPSVSDIVSDKLFDVINSNIVFDEYHELLTDAPLFSAFIYMMRLRHKLCQNTNTLLLSATPNVMEVLWDTKSNPTVVLPNKENHYPPVHANPYRISVTKEMPTTPNAGGLTIYNSIRNAQDKFDDCDILVHSKYTDTDRKIILNELYNNFSKGGNGISKGLKVISSPLIQASMDVSFKSLEQSIISPEDTLQRIGRVNRWGEQDICNLTICIPTDASESSAIKSMYDFNLKSIWSKFVEKEFKEVMTLEEIYSAYAKFYNTKENLVEVQNFIRNCHLKGSESLRDTCEPKKNSRERQKPVSVESSTSKNLRNPEGAYFVTIKDTKGKWLSEPFTCDFYEMNRIFESPLNERNTSCIIKVFNELIGEGFSFEGEVKRLKKGKQRMSEGRLSILSKRKNTPFPDSSRVYERLGKGNSIKDIGRGIIEF